MRFESGDVAVEPTQDGLRLHGGSEASSEGLGTIELSKAEARWLLTTAIPAALAVVDDD